MGNQSGSIASRTVNTMVAYSLIGFTSGFLAPFAYAEYNISQQSSPPALVANTNLGGSAALIGAGVTILLGKFHLTGIYLGSGDYSLSQSTPIGQSATYSNPTGYIVSLEYNFQGRWTLVATYRKVSYSSYSQGGTTSSLGSDVVTQTAAGGGLQWGF